MYPSRLARASPLLRLWQAYGSPFEMSRAKGRGRNRVGEVGQRALYSVESGDGVLVARIGQCFVLQVFHCFIPQK